jgi:CBS domain containing-hemolysin-like protein
MLVALAVILFLILVNALYVAAEFAAVGARRSRLRRLAEDGNPLAARILPVVDDGHALDRYIAVSQIGITLSSLVLGAYGQATLGPAVSPLLVRWAGLDPLTAESTAAVSLLITLTAAQMVLGELVPKSISLQFPTQAALATVLPMQWSQRAFSWTITLLNGSGNLLLKLMRVPATGHRHVHSPEEIELLIAESRDGGLLEPLEQVRLHRALRLGLRTARQLMVPRVRLAMIDADIDWDEAARVVTSSPYSRLPVFKGTPDHIIGILHTKDVVTSFVQRRRTPLAAMLRPIVRVAEEMAADRLLAFLRERRMHQALVVDATGAMTGFITLEDVVAELLGGVSDEFKAANLRVIRLTDGRVRVPASMRMDQVAPLVRLEWRGPVETVAAALERQLRRVPQPGEHVMLGEVPVEVEVVENGVIMTAIVGVARTPGTEPSA